MTAATDFDRWLQLDADLIPVDPNTTTLSADEWAYANFGHGQRLDPICQFGLQPAGSDWSQPSYDVAAADPKQVVTRRVFPASSGYDGNVGGQPRGSVTVTVIVGAQPANSSDRQITFVQPNGDIVNLWGYSAPWTDQKVGQSRGVNVLADAALQLKGFLTGKPYLPFNPKVDLVAGTVEVIPAGSTGNTCLASDAVPMSSGIGDPLDFVAGALTTALAMSVASLLCPPLGSPGAMPAKQGPNGIKGQKNTVPTGQRFRLDPTKVDISSWLISRHYTGILATTAGIAGTGLVRKGWVNVAYTGTKKNPSGPAMLQFRGDPAARDLWRSLGITDPHTAAHLLDGLITPDAIVALAPPVGVLVGTGWITTTNAVVSSFGCP